MRLTVPIGGAFCAAAMLSASLCAQPPSGSAAAPLQATPPVTGGTLEEMSESLEARQILSRMSVPVTVNGTGPHRFVVDSGADRSVIGLGLANRLALPAGKRVTLHGVVGTSSVDTVQVSSLKVGSGEIEDVHAPALPERYLGADGLLGVDALADQRVTLDFIAERMTITAGGRQARGDDEIVVVARRRFGQLILARASVDEDPIYAIVDTGAQVTMGNSALRERVFRKRTPPQSVPVELVGVTGQSLIADLVVLPRIRIGGVLLRNVPVAFSDSPPFRLFGVDKVPAMLLGTDLLRAFRRVTLDFRDKKVRFQLRGDPAIEVSD